MSNQDKSPQWLHGKIKPLLPEDSSDFGKVHYAGHHWSIVKLILLGGWVYVYTTIIPKVFTDFRYVDLLAGSGTTRVRETGDIVMGSALVACNCNFAQTPFSSYLFIEKDPQKCAALKEKVESINVRCTVLEGDCNDYVESIFSEKSAHNLVFVDNEGFDVTWDSIEVILKANTDIIINFPTAMIPRATDPRTASSLDQFYGDNSWSGGQTRDDYLQIYKQKIENRFRNLRKRKAYVSSIRVGTGSYFYDIILVCRMGPFVRAWDYLKKRLDWQDPRVIQTTLDILKQRSKSMDEFLNDLKKEVGNIDKKSSKDKLQNRQTTLGDF